MPSDGIEKLCADLRPIIDLELSLGNRVTSVLVDGWSKCPLAVSLEKPLNFDEIRTKLTLPDTVKPWKNRDSHYAIEAGFMCETTRHSIAGPIVEGK